MRIYQCKARCMCPDCNPANKIAESLDNCQKSLAMRRDLAAAQAKSSDEEGDEIMRRLGIGPYRSF